MKKEIPVYQVKVPEYKLKQFNVDSNSKYFDWYGLKISMIYEYNKPDFSEIGAKIDVCLAKHFLGKKVAIRVLSSQDHKISINELIKIIKKLGHDRYNLARKGDRYDNLENKHIDFFALNFKVKSNGKYFKEFIEPFYYWPIADRRFPIRIDIAIIYDLSKLKVVEHRYKGRENEIKKDGFVFKDQDNKQDALLGIIKIL